MQHLRYDVGKALRLRLNQFQVGNVLLVYDTALQPAFGPLGISTGNGQGRFYLMRHITQKFRFHVVHLLQHFHMLPVFHQFVLRLLRIHCQNSHHDHNEGDHCKG